MRPNNLTQSRNCHAIHDQRGASLIMVLIILTVVSMLGVAGIQISMMSERGARNDRDYQLAWQSAEAGLVDAELDILGSGTGNRRNMFAPTANVSRFIDQCGNTGTSRGLCRTTLDNNGKPAWVSVDFDDDSGTASTTKYGTFTGRNFAAGASGAQSARAPRYVIEAIKDSFGGGTTQRDQSQADAKYIYRVTAMGFGPRADIQSVVQMIYRD